MAGGGKSGGDGRATDSKSVGSRFKSEADHQSHFIRKSACFTSAVTISRVPIRVPFWSHPRFGPSNLAPARAVFETRKSGRRATVGRKIHIVIRT